MKIVYCILGTFNPGGMERVLQNKVTFLSRMGWEVEVVTTDQKGRESFYPFPPQVKMVDLEVNYTDDNTKNIIRKITGYLIKRSQHRRRLTKLLMEERPDITVSLFPSESSFIPYINDGSKKVLELHFCKFFRLQYGRKGALGVIDRWRTRQDERIVRNFDRFVVLTREDLGYWGGLPNIIAIPNSAMKLGQAYSTQAHKRVIAVGRLDYQKGFDRLIDSWALLQGSNKHHDWRLDIFGQGEWWDKLNVQIKKLGIEDTARIHPPVKDIACEYASSSLLVMSSNYEGFPMVMIEAMACGVPVVAFDFKCGPRDIISHNKNGLIVPNGDIPALARAMERLMDDDLLRHNMGLEAMKITATFSEETVMAQWVELFESLVRT